jgi:endoribonuclease LACTB2
MTTNPLIVNVGYKSTNYWIIGDTPSRILFDIGWPGTLGIMKKNIRRMDIPLKEIKYAIASHYHIDHAGLAEELKSEGVVLLVVNTQVKAIPEMKKYAKPIDNYIDITLENHTKIITIEESRKVLEECKISGELLITEGHSDDGISLCLDNGSIFTGDLAPEEYSEGNEKLIRSWQLLRERGGRVIYPAHGPIRQMN